MERSTKFIHLKIRLKCFLLVYIASKENSVNVPSCLEVFYHNEVAAVFSMANKRAKWSLFVYSYSSFKAALPCIPVYTFALHSLRWQQQR